ncbi:MAG: ATP-binding protein [Deltaproteobacteria bacterium]
MPLWQLGEMETRQRNQVLATAPAAVRPPARGLSIFQKLLLLTLSLIAVTVTVPAVYLPARQLERMQATLEAKALAYAALVSKQVESAVAFNDRATAREVFDAVAQDPDVDSLLLLTSSGEVLHARGSATANLAGRATVERPELRVLDSVLRVLQPVVSLEGPRGTLVLELSTRRLVTSRHEIQRQAAVALLLALLFGAAGAYRIARSLSGRLEAIARVADAVARGQLEQPTLPERGKDEIFVVSRAFNAMLRQLRDLITHIRERAEEEQRRLEQLVAERTRELHARNLDMRRVLDHVGQGFLTLDRDASMSSERSAVLERWLGAIGSTRGFGSYLSQTNPDAGAWFDLNWPAVIEDALPIELALDQLPKRIQVGERVLEIEYRPIQLETGELERVLVVLSDRTAELERLRAEADERELTRLFTRLLNDRSGFLEFSSEVRTLLDGIVTETDVPALRRYLHTLKGSAAIYGLDSLSTLCHELEDDLSEGKRLETARVNRLTARWTGLCEKLGPLLEHQRDRFELERVDYEQALAALDQALPHAEIRRQLLEWQLEPTQATLLRLAEHAEGLAERLGKGPIDVRIESGQLRLDPSEWRDFWSAAVHLVRNCIDHGLETPEERQALGKPVPGRVDLRTVLRSGRFTIEVADDGRGIDWSGVAERARSVSLPVATRSDLTEALFAPGLSTRKEVSELSGRGVGLALVKEACDKLGGSIGIDSAPGGGTTFRFSWPASRIEPRATSGAPGSAVQAVRTHTLSATEAGNPRRGRLHYGSQND